eukprot:9403329-Pyramimonas_sp.AAC.1
MGTDLAAFRNMPAREKLALALQAADAHSVGPLLESACKKLAPITEQVSGALASTKDALERAEAKTEETVKG